MKTTSKTPSAKLQIPNKLQTSSTNFGSWCLVFVWILVFGSWSLPPAQAQTRNGALPVITSISSVATFPVTTDNGLNDWKISLGNLVSSLGVGFGATNAIAGNLTSGVVPKAGTTGTNLVDGPIVISAVTNAALTGVFRANAIVSTNAITALSLTTTTNVTAAAYTITGTTNQVTFGATNTAPSSAVAPTKWISVTVTGDAGVYRLPLYE